MAKIARDVMTQDPQCVGENETVLDAARKLADLDVGAMPICGEDDRLKGIARNLDEEKTGELVEAISAAP